MPLLRPANGWSFRLLQLAPQTGDRNRDFQHTDNTEIVRKVDGKALVTFAITSGSGGISLGDETVEKTLILPVGQRDHIRGPLDAAVTIVEYGDYECSLCGQAYAALKSNQERLGNQVRFVFRNFPASDHTRAQNAAEAAEAAGAQNKFWQMHDRLFEHQQALENGFLVEYAVKLGMDATRFLRDMSQHVYAGRVREDYTSGVLSGVSCTPTFFINGMRYNAPWDIGPLLAAIEAAINPE
jgi:protein-disulfide isomerase